MNKKHTLNLCMTGIFTAFVFVVTRFIQIPIPLGYFNVGNCIILISTLFLPLPYAIFTGAIGAALADLLSYPVWTIPTFFIKALMILTFHFIKKLLHRVKPEISIVSAGIISMLIPFVGYTFTGMILYGSIASGIAQIPGLLLEYVANCVIFTIIYIVAFKKITERFLYESDRP